MSDDERSTQCSAACGNNNANSQYDFLLGDHMESYNVETSAIHRKLQSKIEALRILRQELEQFRVERDQYKLMAETLQLRYSALKRSGIVDGGGGCGGLSENSSVARLLHETREQNLKLNTEVEALKQKLGELRGDIELLRVKESSSSATTTTHDKSKRLTIATEHSTHNKEELQWKHERSIFICHLENLKKKNAQLAFDFKAVIDEKEELITERDAYKCKAHRLNHELFVALKANKSHPRFLDIDGVLLENKYLHERVKNQENELDLTRQTVNKYKTMLEAKRKKGIVKLGGGSTTTTTTDETILSPRQVKTILESGIDLPVKTETVQEFKSLCLSLVDNLNDKNLALSHQKKTNKILASKISELEQRLQQLIVGNADSGDDEFGYSPSQLLLNGYCAAMVDEESNNTTTSPKKQQQQPAVAADDAVNPNEKPNEFNETNNVGFGGCGGGGGDGGCGGSGGVQHSDDGMSSLSTESAHSILSSEYGIDVCLNDQFASNDNITCTNNTDRAYKSSSATTDSGNGGFNTRSNGTPCISSAIARERMEDLKDLPPHLAALVQKTLHELDMRDYEALVAIRAANSSVSNV